MFLQKKAMTLVELIVAITISSIILLFLMNFISKVFGEISYSNKKTDAIKKIYSIENQFQNIEEVYSSWDILIDNNTASGADVLIFRNNANNWWYIVGIVDKNTFKLDWVNNVSTIWEKLLAFRKISSQELSELNSTPNKVYNYKFNLDELIPDLFFKNLQVEKYNTGTILELQFEINLDFKKDFINKKYWNYWLKIEKFILDI